MPIDNVRKLMRRVTQDKDLRDRLTKAPDLEGRQAVLGEEGLTFTEPEFDEAVSLLHANCQTQEQADLLKDFRMWWEFLRQS